jgi:hypothetical protein
MSAADIKYRYFQNLNWNVDSLPLCKAWSVAMVFGAGSHQFEPHEASLFQSEYNCWHGWALCTQETLGGDIAGSSTVQLQCARQLRQNWNSKRSVKWWLVRRGIRSRRNKVPGPLTRLINRYLHGGYPGITLTGGDCSGYRWYRYFKTLHCHLDSLPSSKARSVAMSLVNCFLTEEGIRFYLHTYSQNIPRTL